MHTVGKAKEDIPGLKNRIAEVKLPVCHRSSFVHRICVQLERQANDFRTKVEELRRAKAATTVVKTEKEYVNAGASGCVLFTFSFFLFSRPCSIEQVVLKK